MYTHMYVYIYIYVYSNNSSTIVHRSNDLSTQVPLLRP